MLDYNRFSTFDENVSRPVIQAIKDGRDQDTIKGIIEEIVMLACPECGHINPDHSWIVSTNGLGHDTTPCLIGDPRYSDKGGEKCQCEGKVMVAWEDETMMVDNAEVSNATRAAILSAL